MLCLVGSYAVYLGDKPVGKLNITKEGLYYRIVCHCQVPENAVYRLYAITSKGRENLGVVIPEGAGCTLARKISVKQLRDVSTFILSTGSKNESGKFIPICPEEPFSYISQLESAFLEVRGSQTGLLIKEKSGAE